VVITEKRCNSRCARTNAPSGALVREHFGLKRGVLYVGAWLADRARDRFQLGHQTRELGQERLHAQACGIER
jgi:hypothetical protein